MSSDTDAATEALILQLIAEDAGLPFHSSTSPAPHPPAQDFEDTGQLPADVQGFAIDNEIAYEEAEEELIPLHTPLPESEESGNDDRAEILDWGSSGDRNEEAEEEGWEAEEAESDSQTDWGLSNQTHAAGSWNAAEASVPGANWSYGRDGAGIDGWEREQELVQDDDEVHFIPLAGDSADEEDRLEVLVHEIHLDDRYEYD
ncbi:MAG: hypothetical protein M1830_008110 [Pleopsidium flavum]|nr:MAG: hypothetical protein M1830_008110 [Pleopsidium flavum]